MRGPITFMTATISFDPFNRRPEAKEECFSNWLFLSDLRKQLFGGDFLNLAVCEVGDERVARTRPRSHA